MSPFNLTLPAWLSCLKPRKMSCSMRVASVPRWAVREPSSGPRLRVPPILALSKTSNMPSSAAIGWRRQICIRAPSRRPL
jgi:hypothetical protein